MARAIITTSGHLSLEYDDSEHERVKNELSKLGGGFTISTRLDYAKIEICGVEFVVGSDEISRFIISDSDSGDDIIRSLENSIN